MYVVESNVQSTVSQYFALYFGLSSSNAAQDFNASRWASHLILKYNADFFAMFAIFIVSLPHDTLWCISRACETFLYWLAAV
jgi:hypothetical protein